MTDHESLFSELKQLNARLTGIEITLSKMAVQDEKISSLKIRVDVMSHKYDEVFGTEGTISKIKAHQAACPADMLKKSIAQIWKVMGVAVGLIVSIIGAIRIWG